MAQKLVVGPISKGLKKDTEAFNIDNDSFPTLLNAYQWRGRIRRKRGTELLGRLRRYIGTTLADGSFTVTILPFPIISGIVSFTIGTQVFVDPGTTTPVQALLTNGPGTADLDRSTGVLTISASITRASTPVIYYPGLPVMGLEDLQINPQVIPGTLGFDTVYSYNINGNVPYLITDVSFYKNLPTGTYPGYVQKTTWTPTTWNGEDYRQFATINYQGALWATNGVNVTFNPSNFGMQFAPAIDITYISNTATTLTVTIANSPLIIGDFVFANEWPVGLGLNFQTGYVTAAAPNTPAPALKTITITFPDAALTAGVYTPGILQYLTNRSNTAVDCIRWYDGDPTNGVVPPTFVALNGWVNFMPPLSQFDYSIADLPLDQYYLVGAKQLINFKDRLLFLGPVVQSSSGLPIYLQDTVVYSENGTPYYTVSYTNDPITVPPEDVPTSILNIYRPILVPVNQTANPAAWFEDQIGFGGFITAGLSDSITSVSPNEDVLIVGFTGLQTRLVYSGNDVTPFDFYLINSELGTGSSFSVINMDEGVMSRGNRGYLMTNQTSSQRIDLQIPDQVFEVNLTENGAERYTSQRDFINEWVYFTFRGDQNASEVYRFNTQTLQYNYRDNSYAIFNECYTTYGPFRRISGFTWATLPYDMWNAWNNPWNAGNSQLLQKDIIAGNQQGFVLFRDEGTEEGASLYIQNIVGNLVTCPNHCLNETDYIVISGVLGTVANQVNDQIFSVYDVFQNTFRINPSIVGGTYLGGGLITRMYVPFIQTKQFPQGWAIGRKTRIGPQQYLLSTTQGGQITVQIYLSMDSDSPYNNGTIVPAPSSVNNALIYSQIVYTCPESTNMGLTPFNINLNQVTAIEQAQIWHRMNTSLLGDTIQLGFTMSDAQMRDPDFSNQFVEIELHGFVIEVSASSLLA